jgi:hypothetical protein
MDARFWLDTILRRAVEWGYAAASASGRRRNRPGPETLRRSE